MSNDNYITESYLRREIECHHVVPAICEIFNDLMFAPHPVNARTDCDDWASEDKVDWTYNGRRLLLITITSRFYRSGGMVVRGDPQGVSDVPVTSGEYSTERNHTKDVIHHKIDKSVTLEHAQESTLERGIQLDITAKGEAGYGGVTASLETHLGVTVNKTESESSSTTTSQAFSDEEDIQPGEEVVIVYQKTTKRYTQDFTINALADIAFTLEIEHYDMSEWDEYHFQKHPNTKYLLNKSNNALWDELGDNSGKMTFKNVHDFCGFVRGYDVRAPEMKWYQNHMSQKAKAALSALEGKSIFELKLSGTDQIVHDGDADYSAQDIQGVSDKDVDALFGDAGQPLDDVFGKLDELRKEGS